MNYYLLLAIFLFIYMTGWFTISIIKKRNDVADIAWGLGFMFISWSGFFIAQTFTTRGLLVNMLITVWGLRLAIHIFQRNRNKKEDYRYLAWRKQWGRFFIIRSFFQVYLLQGLLLYIVAFASLFINNQQFTGFSSIDVIATLIWIIGFLFESIGDAQLASFIGKEKNKGKIMTEGLWQYSRHPNYFGEVTQWWGIFLFSLSYSNWWPTLVSPLTITILILFVSGIPLLEQKYIGREDFKEYKRKTSIFFPLPPKSI